MGTMSYHDYIHSKEWKVLADQVRYRAEGRCEECGVEGVLEVHHITYARLGHEGLSDLKALCPACHQKAGWNRESMKYGRRHHNAKWLEKKRQEWYRAHPIKQVKSKYYPVRSRA